MAAPCGKDNLSTIDELLWTVSCLRHGALPPLWGTWIHSGRLRRRLWISQAAWLSTMLESE